jgi:membrane protein
MFSKFQDVLQKWLIESLVPDNIARQVLGYLNQFAGKASRLGAVGLLFLLGTASALLFTIDRTLNSIWRVRKPRPFARRVQIYWTALTLGPLLLGVSLSMTSYALTASKGLAGGSAAGLTLVFDALQFVMVAAGMAALYRYVPNTHVRWGHAWMGGVFVSTCMEIAKKALTLYLVKVPTYSVVYGAFATVPILLIWIYVSWVIVLLGAALTAYMPSLLTRVPQRRLAQGWQFQLALELLQLLADARQLADKGCMTAQLCAALRVDPLQLEPVIEALLVLDWVGELNEASVQMPDARYVLLIDPAHTPLAPLMNALLIDPSSETRKLDAVGHWPTSMLGDAL